MKRKGSAGAHTHEMPVARQEVRGSSDRSFGIVFAVVFAIVGLWPLLQGGVPRLWSMVAAAVFLALALVRPRLLAPANRLWMGFGLLLHRVTNPVIMGLVFFLAVVPTALILKLLGKDPLRRKRAKEASSYWIHREPPGPPPESMKNQF